MKIKLTNKFSLCIIAANLFITGIANAKDLTEYFAMAKLNDPTMKSAKEKYLSDKEVLPQAIAALLPQVRVDYTAKANTSTSASSTTATQSYGSYGTESVTLSFTQYLINFASFEQLKIANSTVKSALATLAFAEQSLVTRVTEQYFNILKAEDDLKFTTAQKKAFKRQLDQTQQRFKVGLIAITDVHEAQARLDNAIAEEISAINALENEQEIMQEIVGVPVDSVTPLKSKLILEPPNPLDIEHWEKLAKDKNLELLAARYTLSAAKDKIKQEFAGHLPTMQITGDVVDARALAATALTPRQSVTRSIGLSVSLPVFSGGTTLSSTKSQRHLYLSAAEEYEARHRKAVSDTRQAYRGVLTQIGQVKALKQAVLSNSSALNATQAAFEVGTRTIVDVLDAQSDLISAEKNFSRARYDYILQLLSLKQSAGTLNEQDINNISEMLDKSKEMPKNDGEVNS